MKMCELRINLTKLVLFARSGVFNDILKNVYYG